MAGTATEYIQHHLTHLNNIGAKQGSIVDFSVFNFDTAVFSIRLGHPDERYRPYSG